MSTRITLVIVGTALLTVVHYLLNCKVDYLVAKMMGDVQKLFGSGWTSFGNIKWMFSNILGPALAINKYVGLGVAIASGLFLTLLLRNILFKISPLFGSHYWLAIAILLTWVLRFPVPIKYSLYYFTSVRY
jgi:hypothetical protein